MIAPLIEVLTVPGCPNEEPAQALARDVARQLLPASRVELVRVGDEAAAARLSFPGSPTIRVDGCDVAPRGAPGGEISCRIYEDGSGIPPRWRVEAALVRLLSPRSIVFLCVANSARSQMAEGYARALAPPGLQFSSAGSHPSILNPLAVEVMAEIGIDISAQRSKPIAAVPLETVDLVVTLCAEEVCPVFPRRVPQLHWGLPDPAGRDARAAIASFRAARDELGRRLRELFRPA